jgi:hypothetical protein
MADDFYSDVTRSRLEAFQAARQRALADLSEAKAGGNYDQASESIQEIANIDAASQNLVKLHNSYVQSQQPPQQAPQTDAEWMSKAPERMDYADAMKIHQKSRYAGNLDHNDPLVQAGYREVMARRGRGE